MTTEDINPRTTEIDALSTREILRRINAEDATVAPVVAHEIDAIAAVTERVIAAFDTGGRLIYVGAGTSGRLGALDAAECPPTYSSNPRQVQALLAGGPAAMMASVEAAEDDLDAGARDVDRLDVGVHDVILMIGNDNV